MAKRKKTEARFYYRSIVNNEVVLALLGRECIQEDSSKKHFHNLLEIGVCRKGKGEILTERQKLSYSEGTIVVIPTNEVHMIRSTQDDDFWEYIYIHPESVIAQVNDLRRDRNLMKYLVGNQVIVKSKEEALFLSDEIELLMNQMRVKEYGYCQCVWGLAYTILMEIIKINHEMNNKQNELGIQDIKSVTNITRALDYVDVHFNEDIHTKDIAKAAYVSESFLRKKFQEHFDMSPSQYVNYIRIQKAGKYIRHTDDSIAEIAGKVGYENMSTFINNFKLYTGQTPSMWKENISITF